MREASALMADVVRDRLLSALAPIRKRVEDEALGLVEAGRIRYLVRPRPWLTCQVVIAAAAGRPARPVVTLAASAFPDGGLELAKACDELTAAGLAGVRPELAAGILAFDATQANGGLIAVVDPGIQAAALVFVDAGQPLEQGTVLCGVGDLVTVH